MRSASQEQRDVDLVLGQGMLKAGWHAHKLNAPGKFLVSSPEQDTPRRARAYLVTDDDVTAAAARYAPRPPAPRRHLTGRAGQQAVRRETVEQSRQRRAEPSEPEARRRPGSRLVGRAVSRASEGISIPELVASTGKSRRWVYYRLRELAATGRAVQTTRGLWRALAP